MLYLLTMEVTSIMITIPIKSDKLRELRRDAKVLQMEVEMACDIPIGRLTQFETGRARPTPDHVFKLALYYSVLPSTIIDEEALKTISFDLTRLAGFIGAQLIFNTGEQLNVTK